MITHRTTRASAARAIAGAMILAGFAPVLLAQNESADRSGPRITSVSGGLFGTLAAPIGDFKNYVSRGWGGGGNARWFPGGQSTFAIRADLSLLVYGRQTTRECFGTGCRILVDVTTSNNIINGMVGPELQVPVGIIRPYVNGMAGISVFATQSTADGQSGGPDVFRTTNSRDAIFTAAAGGGIRIPVSARARIDLDVRRHFNGRARYLTRDSFGDGSNPDPLVRESDVDMFTYSIGMSFGIR
jgi:hypothetical protein